MSELKFFERNYGVDAETVIEVSHEAVLTPASHLVDNDVDSVFETSGANNDSTEVTVTMSFFQNGGVQQRSISAIMLLNHNLEEFVAEAYNNDSGQWDEVGHPTGITDEHTVVTFDALLTSAVRIRGSVTQSASEEKRIGEMIATGLIVDMGADETVLGSGDVVNYQPSERVMANEIMMGDGSLMRSVIKYSENRSGKYESRFSLMFLNETQFRALKSLKNSGRGFLIQPESSYRPEEIYYVHWTGPFRWKYAGENKESGFNVDVEVREG